MDRQILTTERELRYSRYVLRPLNDSSARLLREKDDSRTVVPLDVVLGIGSLPFKVSPQMVLEIAYWATKLSSYQDAENYFIRSRGIQISDDSIREITNHVGSIVFEDDCKKAAESRKLIDSCVSYDVAGADGVLYLVADGAALNTRSKDENDSTWRENKLAVAFSDDNIYFWVNRKGEQYLPRKRRMESRSKEPGKI